jgi:2-polyprenyl-6-methoxyphenol hydroxylase-like FAD-dependent oxidoreductase
MRALIVGGSLGGLMSGIELHAAGVAVSIHERSDRVLDDRGAGIVMQPGTLGILTGRCGLKENQTGVWLRFRQYLGKDGAIELHQAMPQLMTSWGLLYQAFRSAFPASEYRQGDALLAFELEKSGVTCRFERSGQIHADLLVGADGSRSLVREVLFPRVKPRYAGYVAWRGIVNEAQAGPELLKTFGDHFTFQQLSHSHILCYLIPGPNGETMPGERRLNWVWYWNVPETRLADVMTGMDGKARDFSMPPGHIKRDIISTQQAIAERVLCPQFLALWEATKEPFLQPILDLSVPKMYVGRAALIGDAAFIPRPHTAASTSKAASNAIALGEALQHHSDDVEAALAAWEPSQLYLGQRLEAHGQALGNRSQFSM